MALASVDRNALEPVQKVVAFSAAVEAGTGVALIAIPSVVASMLLRGELNDVSVLLGRCMGVALIALGIACWPGAQHESRGDGAVRALLAYNALTALFLGYAGAVLGIGGPMLWPAALLHAAVALALVGARRFTARAGG